MPFSIRRRRTPTWQIFPCHITWHSISHFATARGTSSMLHCVLVVAGQRKKGRRIRGMGDMSKSTRRMIRLFWRIYPSMDFDSSWLWFDWRRITLLWLCVDRYSKKRGRKKSFTSPHRVFPSCGFPFEDAHFLSELLLISNLPNCNINGFRLMKTCSYILTMRSPARHRDKQYLAGSTLLAPCETLVFNNPFYVHLSSLKLLFIPPRADPFWSVHSAKAAFEDYVPW